jgi:arginine decarboxylase
MKRMIVQTPTKYFLVSGSAEGYTLLNAFDAALLNAGIGDVNLVKLSSILPPYCEKIEPITLPFGSLVPVAYASITSNRSSERISSAVAIGIPQDKSQAGLIMEFSDRYDREYVENKVVQMVKAGMAYRDRAIDKVLSISATHMVKENGATFAGVVLWS